MKTTVLSFGCILLLQGCVYPISIDLVKKTDKTITFEMLRTDPDLYKGYIILGGSIAAVSNLIEGSLIYTDQNLHDYWRRPIHKY